MPAIGSKLSPRYGHEGSVVRCMCAKVRRLWGAIGQYVRPKIKVFTACKIGFPPSHPTCGVLGRPLVWPDSFVSAHRGSYPRRIDDSGPSRGPYGSASRTGRVIAGGGTVKRQDPSQHMCGDHGRRSWRSFIPITSRQNKSTLWASIYVNMHYFWLTFLLLAGGKTLQPSKNAWQEPNTHKFR